MHVLSFIVGLIVFLLVFVAAPLIGALVLTYLFGEYDLADSSYWGSLLTGVSVYAIFGMCWAVGWYLLPFFE